MAENLQDHLAAMAQQFPTMRPWILGEDGRTPVQTDLAGYLEWAMSVGGLSMRVAYDDLDGTEVSTVFLDQFAMAGHPKREPELFETLVSNAEGQSVEGRYRSWAEAEEGHAEIVNNLRPGPRVKPVPKI